MTDIAEKTKLTFDGVEYAEDDLSEAAKAQIANIKFSDELILQLQNEIAVSNTARNGYLRAFKAEGINNEETNN